MIQYSYSVYLLLNDFEYGILDIVGQLSGVEPILEVSLCRLEILAIGVGARAQYLHQTIGGESELESVMMEKCA